MTPRTQLTPDAVLDAIDPRRPVLIAGPTASGKSDLALRLAETQGGVVVNADASQVYSCWRIVTARPTPEEESRVPHRLYGHVDAQASYSTGHWLREIEALMAGPDRLIIVGGTGLYFNALTEGLADIPQVPGEIRAEGDGLEVDTLIADLDPATRDRIDLRNRVRVQRAWEVLRTTGRGLASWQAETPTPLMPLSTAQAIAFDVEKTWLNARILARFDRMINAGALDEARAVAPDFDPGLPAYRAIGARELVDHVRGLCSLDEARQRVTTATRQFAKRQRTWLRSRMGDWIRCSPRA